MEFVCGVLAAMCVMLAVLLILQKKERAAKPEAESKAEEPEKDGVVWEVTKTARPTREQQYVNMLMYNGENQVEEDK